MRNLSPSYRSVPTLTSWDETKAAWPRTYSTSFRDARTSAYFALRRSATKRSFERITARNSAAHPSSRWSPGNGRFATRKNWSPTASRRLLGTQPTFTHVPPIVPPSIINALAPFRSARIAALKAAAPPPRIIRSCRFAIRSTFPSSPPISLLGKKLACSTRGMKFSSEGELRRRTARCIWRRSRCKRQRRRVLHRGTSSKHVRPKLDDLSKRSHESELIRTGLAHAGRNFPLAYLLMGQPGLLADGPTSRREHATF